MANQQTWHPILFSLIYDCIAGKHNLWLVLVAALICLSGSWATVRLYRRGRLASGSERMGWQFLTATAAGSSVWCTHFIAMLAYEAGVPVTFDPVLTIVSLLVAIVGCFSGFLVGATLGFRLAPALGGVAVGLSVAAMHYIGMRAYRIEGIVVWDMPLVVASILIAGILGALALHIASLGYDLKSKAVATVVLVVAVVSLHFAGMAALTVTPMTTDAFQGNPAAMQAMALAVAVAGLIIVGAVLASYLIDGQTRARSLSDLQKMALSDPLTGLSNRAHFHELLERNMRRASRSGGKFALAGIDLDRFKEINDMRGHSVGDQALTILAQRMQTHFHVPVDLARLGGDEFMVMIDVETRDQAQRLLEDLHTDLLAPFMVDQYQLSVGASIGVCLFPDDATSKDQLINNTDLALYRAKSDPMAKICFFDGQMDEQVRRNRALASDLRLAIENNELELHYQVQTSVSSGMISGYEALLRWNHPEFGRIPPSDFIPLAEQNGLILQLGEWALRTACRQCAHLTPPLKIAVNLSPVQFLHPNLPGLVGDILRDTGMVPQCLELELTESAIISDKARTLSILQKIKTLGVTIALDDFGTGYSSLETLRAFPFDKIKLDRSFVTEVENSQQARSIIRAVLTLGRSLDIPVLAEGIETRDQLVILREEGCDTVQGYLLGRPVPLDDIDLLTDRGDDNAHLLRNTLWELRSSQAEAPRRLNAS